MYATKHPYALHCSALRLAGAVTAEYPAVSLTALMESELLLMYDVADVISLYGTVFIPPTLFLFYGKIPLNQFPFAF